MAHFRDKGIFLVTQAHEFFVGLLQLAVGATKFTGAIVDALFQFLLESDKFFEEAFRSAGNVTDFILALDVESPGKVGDPLMESSALSR